MDHVDRGLLTLVTNHDGALQVLLQGKWIDVPRTNGLVVFAGKTLELLTHGKYPAVVHRIAPGRGSGRVSLAFKLRAPPETKLVLHGEHDESAAMTTVGDFFDMHVDKPGLSINRPSPSRPRQAERMAANNGYADTNTPELVCAQHAQLACHSQVRSQVIPPDLRVVPLPVLHLCDLKAFTTCRAISREWHGHCNSSELCWVRFCFQRGFPWLQKQVDWPAHFRAWQQRMQNWKSQKKIEAVALPVPFGLFTNLRPHTSACQSLRFSAAVEKWGLSGLSEVCFYRPEEGKRTTELESCLKSICPSRINPLKHLRTLGVKSQAYRFGSIQRNASAFGMVCCSGAATAGTNRMRRQSLVNTVGRDGIPLLESSTLMITSLST